MTGRDFFDLGNERGILRASIAATLAIAVLGVGCGLASGSVAVVFDAVYSLVDAGMCLLSLAVASLIRFHTETGKLPPRLRERFTMGFWHLEPMVLAFNGTVLLGIVVYALVDAAAGLISGRHIPSFGLATLYASVTVVVCLAAAWLAARANRTVASEFVRLDIKGWISAAAITGAMLVAFGFGLAVQGTAWEWMAPYIDPVILGGVCLVLLPMPVSTLRQSLADIFMVTPADLQAEVEAVARDFAARHGFSSFRAYIARRGRSHFIELYFIVPSDAATRPLAEWDRLRDEVGRAIGGEGPDRWLTIVFTGDPDWAE